jgi:hypothetical protein
MYFQALAQCRGSGMLPATMPDSRYWRFPIPGHGVLSVAPEIMTEHVWNQCQEYVVREEWDALYAYLILLGATPYVEPPPQA